MSEREIVNWKTYFAVKSKQKYQTCRPKDMSFMQHFLKIKLHSYVFKHFQIPKLYLGHSMEEASLLVAIKIMINCNF